MRRRGEISSIFIPTFSNTKICTHSNFVPELSALSEEGGGVISLEGDREWRPTMEERGEGEGVWGSMIVRKLFIAAMET